MIRNYRYLAQQSAQFNNFHKAENQLLKYLEGDKITPIQKHFAYTDLILYTFKQFNDDSDAMNRCLNYCHAHIKLIPFLNSEFQKFNFVFDYEFIVSIEIAIILLVKENDDDKIMALFNELSSYYSDKKNQNIIAEMAYKITYKDDKEKYKIDNIEDVFTKYFKFIKNKNKF